MSIDYYSFKQLRNSIDNSPDMNVDGSVTNVSFEHAPTSGVSIVKSIIVFLLHAGPMTHNSFAALSGTLTNGIEVKTTIAEETRTLMTAKSNVCLSMIFSDNVLSGSSSNGFLDSNDYFQGVITLPEPLVLNYEDGDKIECVIKDDLSSIGVFRMRLKTVVPW